MKIGSAITSNTAIRKPQGGPVAARQNEPDPRDMVVRGPKEEPTTTLQDRRTRSLVRSLNEDGAVNVGAEARDKKPVEGPLDGVGRWLGDRRQEARDHTEGVFSWTLPLGRLLRG